MKHHRTTNSPAALSNTSESCRSACGTWVDPSSVPSNLSDSQIRAAAAAEATSIQEGRQLHGCHRTATTHRVSARRSAPTTARPSTARSYSNIPYMTDAYCSCGENWSTPAAAVARRRVSIVTGQKKPKQTDPQVNSHRLGEQPVRQIGDICAWQGLAITPRRAFAVQPLWSNKTSACAVHPVNDDLTSRRRLSPLNRAGSRAEHTTLSRKRVVPCSRNSNSRRGLPPWRRRL